MDDIRQTEWWKRVVAAVGHLTGGLHPDDLPDYCYADAHEDGLTPVQTARLAIRAARE